MTTIDCPRHWDTVQVAEFNLELAQHLDDEKVIIDFRPVYFVRPFGTLLLAESVRQFAARRKERGLQTRAAGGERISESTSDALSYLKHIGFFRFIRLKYGKAPGEAPGSDAYLPITQLDFEEIGSVAPGVRLQEALKIKCEDLAGVLVQDDLSRIMIGYCLREVVRNVYEHAQVGYCIAMAQKYPRKNRVEIAILDTGCGIYQSLRGSHSVDSPAEAIAHALLPGVSCVLDLASDDPWANSGFGLHVLSTLGRKLGRFEICSSGVLQIITADSASSRNLDYDGTGIRLMISYEDSEYFPNLLESIIREGEQEAFGRTGIKHSASMSTMGLWAK